MIDALEVKVNAQGTMRVRFELGWVSQAAGNGAVVLEPVDAPAPAPVASSVAAADLRFSGAEEEFAEQFEMVDFSGSGEIEFDEFLV